MLQGDAVARKIGAIRYFECSGVKNEGLREVLEYVARIALMQKSRKAQKTCAVM
jgi:Rho family, other